MLKVFHYILLEEYKGGELLLMIPSLADEENYQLEEGTLKILSIKESNIGVYNCEVDGTVLKSYELSTSLKIKKFPKSISVNDGLNRELTCTFNSPVSSAQYLERFSNKVWSD